jgi:hypothetical protein
MTTQKDIILELTRLATVIAPKVKELGDHHGPAFERTLWPGGAPAAITWTMIWEQQLERARESTEELVRRDVEIATERGQPWPGGASIRPETAARVAHADRMLKVAETMDKSVADLVLFRGEPAPERLSVEQLVTRSATGMLWLAREMHEGNAPEGAAELLRAMIADVVTRLVGLCHTIGRPELADPLDELLPRLSHLDAVLVEPAEPAEPAAHPLAPSGAEAAALLARMAAETRRITPALVELIERDLFEGTPPARVSFVAIQAVIDERLTGDGVPARERQVHRMVGETDELLLPEDDDPFSALELLEATAEALENASERLLELSPEERDEAAPEVELYSRVLLLNLIAIGHATRHQLLVADIASTIGFDPIPFPGDLESGGSA